MVMWIEENANSYLSYDFLSLHNFVKFEIFFFEPTSLNKFHLSRANCKTENTLLRWWLTDKNEPENIIFCYKWPVIILNILNPSTVWGSLSNIIVITILTRREDIRKVHKNFPSQIIWFHRKVGRMFGNLLES